jgi:hypothetical protein
MSKISYLILSLILISGIAHSEQGRVKIVPCDGHYCTQLESGEDYKIVKQVDWALNKLTLSPNEEYVAYTTSNGLGFENEGRDVYYCKIDGSKRTFLHKFDFSVDTLLWVYFEDRDFIFVISWDCYQENGGIQVLDLAFKNLILTFQGNELKKIEGTNCYQVYCLDKPVQKERERICLEDLSTIKEPDTLNLRFFAGWSSGDIYISTERDPLIKFGDPTTSPNQDELSLRSLLWSGRCPVSKIIPDIENNRIVFYGERDNFGFYGAFDLENKKLLLFNLSDSLKFSDPVWSPNGGRLALLRKNNWETYVDFYEVDEKGEMYQIKTYRVTTDRPISDFRWSDDSKKFYYFYPSANYQKVQVEVDVEDR